MKKQQESKKSPFFNRFLLWNIAVFFAIGGLDNELLEVLEVLKWKL